MKSLIIFMSVLLLYSDIAFADCSGTSQGDCSGTSQATVKKSTTKKEFVVNGNFKERYKGWERAIGDVSKGSSKTEIIPFPNGLPGQLLHIRHQGEGNIQFSQTVDVPSPDLIFSVSFQASPHEGPISGFSGSGVSQIALQYLNENGDSLGQTTLLNYVKNPFADTPLIGVPRRTADTNTVRYIELGNNKFYTGYKIDIRKEIEDNLLGVNIDDIKRIAIAIWCGASHSQAGSELWITDIGIKLIEK